MALPDTLVAKEEHWRRAGRIVIDSDDLFRDASWLAVLHGQAIDAQDYNPLADALDGAANRAQLDQIAAVIERAVPTLPGHDDVIAGVLAGAGPSPVRAAAE